MPESAAKLRATIAELETELRNVGTLDAETKAMLELALEEIQATLRHEHSSATGAAEPHTLTERLELSATEFETSHPTLAGVLRRLVDALSQLGI